MKPMTPEQAREFWKKYPNIGKRVIAWQAQRAEQKAQRRKDNEAEIQCAQERINRRQS